MTPASPRTLQGRRPRLVATETLGLIAIAGVALQAAIAVSGLAQFGTGLFNADPQPEDDAQPTFSGQMHEVLGLLSFVGLLVAAFALRSVFARDPRWRPPPGRLAGSRGGLSSGSSA